MNRVIFSVIALCLVAAIAVPTIAQDRPPRQEERRDDRGPGPRGPMPGDAQRPHTLNLGPEATRMMALPPELQRMEMMRGYIDVVDRFARLSRDPTSAGVAAVVSAADLLRPRGAEAGIEYFTRHLETAKSDAIRRAIRVQLVELYKHSGQHDKALEQLTELINAAPPGVDEPPAR